MLGCGFAVYLRVFVVYCRVFAVYFRVGTSEPGGPWMNDMTVSYLLSCG